jgi:hypothetical protein
VYRVLPPELSRHQCIVYYDELAEADKSMFQFGKHQMKEQMMANGERKHYLRKCEDYSEPIYPINRLRNIAIQNIRTTHFLVVDMDMWPASISFIVIINNRLCIS